MRRRAYPDAKPGQRQLSARDFNDAMGTVEAVARIQASRGVRLSTSSAGIQLGGERLLFRARLTAAATQGYSWVEVIENGTGGWTTLADGRAGGPGNWPAYEDNDATVNADPTTGTIVELRPGQMGEYYMFQAPASRGPTSYLVAGYAPAAFDAVSGSHMVSGYGYLNNLSVTTSNQPAVNPDFALAVGASPEPGYTGAIITVGPAVRLVQVSVDVPVILFVNISQMPAQAVSFMPLLAILDAFAGPAGPSGAILGHDAFGPIATGSYLAGAGLQAAFGTHRFSYLWDVVKFPGNLSLRFQFKTTNGGISTDPGATFDFSEVAYGWRAPSIGPGQAVAISLLRLG